MHWSGAACVTCLRSGPCTDSLLDTAVRPDSLLLHRFVPLENLEEQYASNRKRRRLLYALRRHHTPGSYRGRLDAFCNEVFIACQLFFDRCTPRRMRAHPPWFTAAFLAVCITRIFFALNTICAACAW